MLLAAVERRTIPAPAAVRCRPLGPAQVEHRQQVFVYRHAIRTAWVPPSHAVYEGRPKALAQSEEGAARRIRPTMRRDEKLSMFRRRRSDQRGRILGILTSRAPRKLPLLYLVEDNGYAISVPVEVRRPVGHLETRAEFSWAATWRSATAPIPSKATPFARKRCSTARASRVPR